MVTDNIQNEKLKKVLKNIIPDDIEIKIEANSFKNIFKKIFIKEFDQHQPDPRLVNSILKELKKSSK